MSEFTKKQVDCEWQYLDEINVKGKEIPVKIYAPLINKELRKLTKTP